jgi:exonuclease SbcC
METAANDARRESEQFARTRERSVALSQQLRQLAREIITEETGDECPLCHTRFKPGELARHMASGVDEHVEAAAQKLLANVARLDSEYRLAVATETALGQIVRYCIAARLSADATIGDTLAKVYEAQTALSDARRRSDVLNSEIQSLKAQGISLERLNVVGSQLNALGFTGTYQSPEHVAALRRTIQDSIRASSEKMQATTKAITQLQTSFEVALRPWRAKVTDPRGALAQLEERRVTTQEIQSRLVQLSSRFPWQSSRPIGEWIVEGESVRGIATKLQTALGMERVAAKTLTETIRRRDQLRTLSQQLGDRIGRLREATNALQAIVKNQSLEALTRAALQDNRKGIETIFSQIHSPAEFAAIEIDNDSWKLKRKVGDEYVKLTQISTGQRAAFALSVFLAQNAQLTAGPQVILIDDPIAHVDDLNCLSFLDYLREVALTGKRQIFFATASDKLASLFERKFDFLGSRFKRFNLTRAENA